MTDRNDYTGEEIDTFDDLWNRLISKFNAPESHDALDTLDAFARRCVEQPHKAHMLVHVQIGILQAQIHQLNARLSSTENVLREVLSYLQGASDSEPRN